MLDSRRLRQHHECGTWHHLHTGPSSTYRPLPFLWGFSRVLCIFDLFVCFFPPALVCLCLRGNAFTFSLSWTFLFSVTHWCHWPFRWCHQRVLWFLRAVSPKNESATDHSVIVFPSTPPVLACRLFWDDGKRAQRKTQSTEFGPNCYDRTSHSKLRYAKILPKTQDDEKHLLHCNNNCVY